MDAESWVDALSRGFMPRWVIREQLGVPIPSDPNPFPYFHLFGRRKPAQPPRCTGDPCICTNGIGCVTIPMEMW